MREKLVGLLAAALMSVCDVASANIIYNVDISGGGETVTGQIITDGDSGTLTAADFVSWSLSATGVVSVDVTGSNPGHAVCSAAGCGVSAVGGTLAFIGSVPEALNLNGPDGFIGFFPGFFDVAQNDPQEQITVFLDTPYVVASVPEPPTAILLGIALACLGLVCTRVQGRQSAAV